jgi:hypothetical protein
VLVVHSYWGLWAPRAGLRDELAEWLAFRVWRVVGYKDLKEQGVFNDPGGPATIFPEALLMIGEWNSPDNSRGIDAEYSEDVIFFLSELQTRYSKNLIGSALFLYKSAGVDHGEYTHFDRPMIWAMDTFIESLPQLGGSGVPIEPPTGGDMFTSNKFFAWLNETTIAHGLSPAHDGFLKHITAIDKNLPVTQELVDSVRIDRDAAIAQLVLLEARLPLS